MPKFTIDEGAVKAAQKIIEGQKKLQDGVAARLKKIKDGYFSGDGVVLESGLSKDDVKVLIETQDKVKKLGEGYAPLERAFEQSIHDQHAAFKRKLKEELDNLDADRDKALKLFPKGSLYGIVGHGPEADLKKAYAKMK